MCSLADFRASLSVMPGSVAARRMTVTSGRTCTAALTKSSPLGLLLKTLLESSRWSSRARYLRWQVKELYSTRVTTFDDTNFERPLPWNESAVTSKQTDMKSSRCLFQLVPSEPPTDETGCSSSDTVLMLHTPTAQEPWITADRLVTKDGLPAKIGERAYDKYTGRLAQVGLTQQVQMMQFNGMLPTPLSQGLKVCDKDGKTRFMPLDLLPTPTAIEGIKWTNTWNPNSQMGQSLSAMAASGMLPTPRTSGQEGYESRAARKGHECAMSYLETAIDYVAHQTNSVPAGQTSRLSPLFTEEMMGFPYRHTTMPFTKGETAWIEIV